jgi:branched-chain amino acid transport system substrate-binding protein
MVNRRTAVLSVTSIAAGFSATLAGCGSNVPDTLKIGVVVAQSGPFGTRGKDLLRGAEMAVDEINQQQLKIGGKAVKVELVSFDDKGDNDAAAEGAKQLVESGVAAVIGPMNSPQGIKAVPVVAEAGLPHLFTMTPANLHALGKGNTFRLLANDDLQARAAASFVHETLRGQRIVSVYESTDYGKGLNRGFAETFGKMGGKVGSTFAVDPKADVTTEIASKIKSENADVIMLFSREPHLKSLFKALQDVAYTNVAVVGANPIRTKSAAAAAIPVQALYATATAIDAEEFVNGAAFIAAFEAKYKERPVWGAHYTYDAVHALAGAVRSAETMEPAKLVAWLKTKELRTRVNHQMRFEGSGEQYYASIAVYKAERASWALQMRSSQW